MTVLAHSKALHWSSDHDYNLECDQAGAGRDNLLVPLNLRAWGRGGALGVGMLHPSPCFHLFLNTDPLAIVTTISSQK